jgi:PhnB protein
MKRICSYLNFAGKTEEAFLFYKSIFGGEFKDGIFRFGDVPVVEGMPPVPENEKNLVMHIELPISESFSLMGSDVPESMGFPFVQGNNIHIFIEPNSREEADKIFKALSDGGKVTMELQDTFWNAYYGSCTDKYGVQWMFNLPNPQ